LSCNGFYITLGKDETRGARGSSALHVASGSVVGRIA